VRVFGRDDGQFHTPGIDEGMAELAVDVGEAVPGELGAFPA
jgi:hypothetical protein